MKKSQTYSLIVTIVSGVLIVLLLMLLYMPFDKTEQEEGVMISFGDGIEGLGDMPSPVATTPPAVQPTPPPPAAQEDLLTQNIEETVDLQAQEQERERKRQEQIEAEQRRQELLEQQRIEAERIAEQQRIEAENAAKTAKANQAANVFGQKIGGVGQSSGSGTAGNPAGKGSSGGHSWSLNGRDLRGKIHEPIGQIETGKVVIEIRVDKNGNVINAKTTQGTNISSKSIIDAVLEAAKKTKFSAGTSDVIGTITYNFKLT